MLYKYLPIKIRVHVCLVFAVVVLTTIETTNAQIDGGLTVGPPKMEIVIPAGGEKTVGMAVTYTRDFPTAKLPLARLVARLEDWTIKGNGEISFAPIGTMPRSSGDHHATRFPAASYWRPWSSKPCVISCPIVEAAT